jgi:hypothetical protein
VERAFIRIYRKVPKSRAWWVPVTRESFNCELSVFGEIVPMAGSTVILGYNGPDPYIRVNIPFLGLNGPYSRKLLFERSTFGSSFALVLALAIRSTTIILSRSFCQTVFISILPTKLHLFALLHCAWRLSWESNVVVTSRTCLS